MPLVIEKLDSEQNQLTEIMSGSEFYKQDKDKIKETTQRLSEIEGELEAAYEKWDALES